MTYWIEDASGDAESLRVEDMGDGVIILCQTGEEVGYEERVALTEPMWWKLYTFLQDRYGPNGVLQAA